MIVPAENGCAWPLWADGERPTHRYCGAERATRDDGRRLPYCATHAAVAYCSPRSTDAAPAADITAVAA